jgi:hypothetical protein
VSTGVAGATRLFDTVGGSLPRLVHTNDATLIIATLATAAREMTAALLPLRALRNPADRPAKIARSLAWIAAGTVTTYRAALTTAGLLVQADVIPQLGERRPASFDLACVPQGSLVSRLRPPDRGRTAA